MHCGQHLGVTQECEDHFGIQKPQHTFWVCLTQTYTQLDYVFLLESFRSEQSATTLGGSQDANAVCNFMFIT